MQIIIKKLFVHHCHDHATSSSVLKFIIFMNSENDLDVSDEKINERMSSDALSTLKFLLDLSQTSRNRRMISHVLSI